MKLIETAVKLTKKYRELIMYGIFGVLTTIVNFASYAAFTKLLSVNYIVSTVLAWVLAVAFAYVTNKIFVFNSRNYSFKYVVREIAAFFLCRALSGGFDVLCMYIFVDIFNVNRYVDEDSVKCDSGYNQLCSE